MEPVIKQAADASADRQDLSPLKFLDFSRRLDALEIMDADGYPPEKMRRALLFLRLTNRRFGGDAVVLGHLERFSQRWPLNFSPTVLDVGTGLADIPTALVRWARARGMSIRVTALDRNPAVLDSARREAAAFPEIDVREGDFFDLARSGETFDYVTASLFLHHIRPGQEVEVLRGFDRLARRGVIISDLSRGPLAYAGVWLLSRLVGDEVVRHDGPMSVRRAFRPEELNRLARDAGLDYLHSRRHPWFRLSLAGEKEVSQDHR